MRPLDIFGVTMAPLDVLAATAGVAAAVTVLSLWRALMPPSSFDGRIAALRERREALRSAVAAPRRSRHRHVRGVGLMRRAVTRLDLTRGQHVAAMTLGLARAGFRSRDALVIYLFFKLAMPLVAGAAAGAAMILLPALRAQPMVALLCAMTGVVAGAYLPDLLVKNMSEKRRERIQRALPDVLDLLVVCAQAGLSLEAALTRAARETRQWCPEIADELGLTAVELGFLPDRAQALNNLVKRVDLPSVRALATTLQQAERYGTPLAQSLRVLVSEYRGERLLKAEEKAARLPATLTVPLVVFILPCLFVVLLGPAIIGTIDALRGL
ncbi:MAG: type II secretion system F family protein [Acetobacterales bacterium]